MTLLALPMILSYQIGIVLVWYVNRKLKRPAKVQKLIVQDQAIQREREERLKTVEYVWEQSKLAGSLAPLPSPVQQPRPETAAVVHASPTHAVPVAHHVVQAASPQAMPIRSQKYVNDFINLRRPSDHGTPIY